jgi:hypothetical protein
VTRLARFFSTSAETAAAMSVLERPETREECEDGVAVGGESETGEPFGCLEGLGSVEAAGGDEVVLDGERFCGNGCGGGE